MPTCRTRNPKWDRRPAATLIETIAVTALTTILVSQIIPPLAKVRQKSQQLSCAEKLGQIARAGLTYASRDPSEFAIPIGEGDARYPQIYHAQYGFGGKSGLGPDPNSSNPSTSLFGGGNWLGAPHRPLNTILFKKPFPTPTPGGGGRGGGAANWSNDARLNVDIYHCPSDLGFPGMHYSGWRDMELSSYNFFGTSYAANAMFIGGVASGSQAYSNSAYARSLSGVPHPAETVLYWENAARYAMFANNPAEHDQAGCHCWPWAIGGMTAHGHHGEDWHFNVSFSDGHASRVRIKGYGRTELPLYPPNLCASEADCCCMAPRGSGWRLDTLPAAPVATNKLRSGSNGTLIVSQDGGSSAFQVVP